MSTETESKTDQQLPDFEVSYAKYKFNEELDKQQFEVEYFSYKLELILYTFVVAVSLFFILYTIFSYMMNLHFVSIENVLFILESILIFGYIAFFISYLIKRKKRKFQNFLIQMHKRQSQIKKIE